MDALLPNIFNPLYPINTLVRTPIMDQLPQNKNNDNSRKDHPLDEKGVVNEVVVPVCPDGESDVCTATQPYRLYKRRWIGVFAMVSTPFPATYCS
jgi:hypothetical protein